MTNTERVAKIQAAIKLATEYDHDPMFRSAVSPDGTPWIPFPWPDFVALVAEALPEAASGTLFLEIGCGIGTRMLLAQEIFGLDVTGIDAVPELVSTAQTRMSLPNAILADAREFEHYGKYDLIWFNRPLRDAADQLKLEEHVWEAVKPGAVVICANLEGQPPANWWLVLDDMEVRRGIWQKP